MSVPRDYSRSGAGRKFIDVVARGAAHCQHPRRAPANCTTRSSSTSTANNGASAEGGLNGTLDAAAVKLRSYRKSLEMLEQANLDSQVVDLLRFEVEALEALPPEPRLPQTPSASETNQLVRPAAGGAPASRGRALPTRSLIVLALRRRRKRVPHDSCPETCSASATSIRNASGADQLCAGCGAGCWVRASVSVARPLRCRSLRRAGDGARSPRRLTGLERVRRTARGSTPRSPVAPAR